MSTALAATAATPTTPQFMAALAEANRIRFARSAAKRAIYAQPDRATSLHMAADLIEHLPDELTSMPIGHLLRACRRVGPRDATKFLARIPLGELKPLGALTDRQRGVLVAAIRGWAS